MIRGALWFRTGVRSIVFQRSILPQRAGRFANSEQAVCGNIWLRAFRKDIVQLRQPLHCQKDQRRERWHLCATETLCGIKVKVFGRMMRASPNVTFYEL